MNVVTRVVQYDTCSGCGVCAGVCPHRVLEMGFDAKGDLVPHVTSSGCTDCGLCLAVCPFASGVHDPRELNLARFGSGPNRSTSSFHDDVGWYHSALIGYSAHYRPTSASGGLVSALLAELLKRGEVDAVGVVSQTATDSGVVFSFRKVTNAQELAQFSGSVYHPVEASGLLEEIIRNPNVRWALVGVPCLCAALRVAGTKRPALNRSLVYVIGLACGMYQNRMYTELLIRQSGLSPYEVSRLNYREKTPHKSASNFGFRAISKQGVESRGIPYHGLPFFLGAHGYFRCNACNFCRDVFAEAADACFMDAWLPEYRNDPEGTSLVLFRNAKLRSMLESAVDCKIHEATIEQVTTSQRSQILRKRQSIQARLRHPAGKSSLKQRIDWTLERATQHRSKSAWARFGRSGRVWCFWLMMADLIVLTHAVSLTQRIWSRLGRVTTLASGVLTPRSHK